jgi:hypothetical protein
MKKALWKSNLNFVKDLPMIYANSIVIAVRVPGLKKRRF